MPKSPAREGPGLRRWQDQTKGCQGAPQRVPAMMPRSSCQAQQLPDGEEAPRAPAGPRGHLLGFLLPPPGGHLARMQYFRVSLSVPRCPCGSASAGRCAGFLPEGTQVLILVGVCSCSITGLCFPRPRLRETFLPGRVSRPSALARAWPACASAPSRMQPVFRYGDGLGLNAAQERSLWPSALWGSPPAPAHLGRTCLTDCQAAGPALPGRSLRWLD